MNFAKKSVLLAATALSAAWSMPAMAQDSGEAEDGGMGNDIVVTARRSEEKLQDVPISITVLSAEKLANNNITSAKDIATYTPGLSTNNRFGSDNTTWTIRGFTQEQRTTATVGTYFNDVVAPRGSGATQGGDGAGPGNLFDLANVQVLKGPQGTLQGRNSTGGAVLLVPKKPVDKLEGYLEVQAGDYNLFRVQGVVNAPINDSVRVRLGFDRMKRDGYLQNVGKIGFGPNGDAGGSVDYWAARAGIVIDMSPDLENYTVATWSRTKSTGVIPKITQAFYREPYSGVSGVPGPVAIGGPLFFTPSDIGQPTVNGVVTSFGQIAQNQIDYEAANCGGNFWCVTNPVWDSRSESRTWQAINTTTWKASDSLTVKGILSYGEFRGDTTLDLFGLSIPYNAALNSPVASPLSLANKGTAFLNAVSGPLGVRSFSMTRAPEGLHTNAESSFVAELQFQGHGENFNWQDRACRKPAGDPDRLGTGLRSRTEWKFARTCWPFADRKLLPRQGGLLAGHTQALGATEVHSWHSLHMGHDAQRLPTHEPEVLQLFCLGGFTAIAGGIAQCSEQRFQWHQCPDSEYQSHRHSGVLSQWCWLLRQ
jgi:iron complex outermembrane recepter protein